MCEHFVRRLNLFGSDFGYQRHDNPMEKSETKEKHALIAEYAFSIFAERSGEKKPGKKKRTQEEIESAALTETKLRLRPYTRQGLDLESPLIASEIDEVRDYSGATT